MKIKEVIAQTGLTDRAIRLYIENELVHPESNESFNGRKSIEFSENDVQQLKNIALLRKANFAISAIKNLQDGGDEARSALESHIVKLREDIENNTKVLEALEGFDDSEEINVQTVCGKISDLASTNRVPSADMYMSSGEVARKLIFGIIGIGGMVVSSFLCYLYIWYCKSEFMFTKLDISIYVTDKIWNTIYVVLLIFLPLILLILSTIIVIVTFKRRKPKKKKWKKLVASIVLSAVLAVTTLGLPFSMVLIIFIPPVCSETSDPFNYMHLDNGIRQTYADSILEVFPATMPWCASTGYYEFKETTKYYYRYSDVVEEMFTIVAEWVLTDTEYSQTVQKMSEQAGDAAFRTTKGDWKCIYFKGIEYQEYKYGYYYLIFAYNDTTKTVRYIADYSLDGGLGDKPPHYFLEWK